MTQYDEVKEFIRKHPSTTRSMLREKLPHITHENEILNKLVESGEGHRERVEGKNRCGCWGYFVDSR